MTTFVPRVTSTKRRLPAAVKAWAQEQATRSYQSPRFGEQGLETEAIEVCASRGPVLPHVDAWGKENLVRGMRIIGLVIRSDGHRLHSDNLEAAGVKEGLALREGDIYEIDVFDRHWTTAPGQPIDAEVIFSVHIMHPDGRKPDKLAHDYGWSLIAASIETLKARRTA